MKSIHFVCEHQGQSWRNLRHENGHRYFSGYWDISEDDARQLVGGWLYLHEAKAEPSGFGGKILGFQVVSIEASHSKRIDFEIEARVDGGKQKWRGSDHDRAWTSGPVNADLSHEAI